MSTNKLQTTGFLDLPPEIRTQIYMHILDVASISTGIRTIRRSKVLAISKIGLLLVNKLIHSETLPVFYKYHQFSFPIHNIWFPPPFATITKEGRWELLIHLELVYEDWIGRLDTPVSDLGISKHLRFIQARCPKLRTLRLELRPKHQTPVFFHKRYRDQVSIPPPGTINPQTVGHIPVARLGVPPGSMMMPSMNAQYGMSLASMRHMPGVVPGLGVAPTWTGLMATNPPPGIPTVSRHFLPGTTPLIRQRRNQSLETHFIDKNGASVQSLKEIWGRLDKFTIVIPRMGDFGEAEFQNYLCKQVGEVVVPGIKWKSCVANYEGKCMWLRGARRREWSVCKELH